MPPSLVTCALGRQIREREVYLVRRLGVQPEARARAVAGILEEMFADGD